MGATQVDSDREYNNWRKMHLDGFVANIKKTMLESYFVVHKSGCSTIKQGSSRSNRLGAFTEGDYRKVVGITLESIVDWGHSNGFPFRFMRACQRRNCLYGVKLSPPTSPFVLAERRPRPFDATRLPKTITPATQHASPEETFAQREKATRGHHKLLVALDRALKAAGWTDIEEIPLAIDLWARAPKSRQRIIFEAKTLGDELHQARAALAQLLEYRHVYGNKVDELCLVLNRRLSGTRERILGAMGITVIWQDGDGFRTAGHKSRSWVSSLLNEH